VTLNNRYGWATLAVILCLALVAAWQWESSWLAAKANHDLTAAPDEGDRREEVLRRLTEVYVSRGKEVSERMRGGLELAPVPFLNSELERQGAKWRVGTDGGAKLEYFDVS
jgi:hypothetical protein